MLPLSASSNLGVIAMQLMGDGDNLIGYGELWVVTIAIKISRILSQTRFFVTELEPRQTWY